MLDRPHVSGLPSYDRMRGYEPYMERPVYSSYAERAVFDYSDRRDGSRYGDRPSYDSTLDTGSQSGFSRQVVDYNHGSLSVKSSDDDRAPKKEREQPVTSGRDVAESGIASRTESQHRPATTLDADVDIKFIQDTIVSIFIPIKCFFSADMTHYGM